MKCSIVLGYILVFTSILDAIKYTLQANKIRAVKSAKNQSRRFINYAILNDIVKLAYGFSILDYYIIISSVLALFCMLDLFFTTYLYYPYRNRGLLHFKKPNIVVYFYNSILSNEKRKRL